MDRRQKAAHLTNFNRDVNHISSQLLAKACLYVKSYVGKRQKILKERKRLPKSAFPLLLIFVKAYLYIFSDEKVTKVRDSMECSPRINCAYCLPRSKPFSSINNLVGNICSPLASPQEV